MADGCLLSTSSSTSSHSFSSSGSYSRCSRQGHHVPSSGGRYRYVLLFIPLLPSSLCLSSGQKEPNPTTTRPCLCCTQLVMHDCDKPIKGPALCWPANYFTRLSASRLLPPSSVFFSLPFSREIHLLRRAEPRCAEEAVGAREKDVPHYQQPL